MPVDVTFVPVAFVNVSVERVVPPVTESVPVIVRLSVIANGPVDVPPANWIAFVVVFPAFVTVWKLAAVPDGQFVPLARQTCWPSTKSEAPEAEPNVRFDAKRLVAVAFVARRVVIVPFVAFNVAMVPFVEVRFVIVPLVARKVVPVAEVKESEVIAPFVTVPFVANKFVAKRLVDVVFVPVAFVQVKPETVSGAVRVRLPIVAFVALNVVAKRLVEVEFVEVVLVKMPVEGVVPPMDVLLIVPPLIVALEEMRVGAVSVLMVPLMALIVVPVAVAKPKMPLEVPFPKLKFVIDPSVMVAFVIVPLVVKLLVVVTEVPWELVKKRLVANKFVPVPDVNVVACNDAAPPTVNVPVTERSFVIASAPVEVPPANWIVLVVIFPAFVTLCSVPPEDAIQFVPSARQTAWPFTKRDDPDADAKLNKPVDVPFPNESPETKRLVTVAFVAVKFVTVPFDARMLDPVADVNEREVIAAEFNVPFVAPRLVANKFVEVEFVPVAFVQFKPPTVRGLVSVRFPIDALVANRFVVVAFVITPLVTNAFVREAFVPVALVQERFVELNDEVNNEAKLPVDAAMLDPVA